MGVARKLGRGASMVAAGLVGAIVAVLIAGVLGPSQGTGKGTGPTAMTWLPRITLHPVAPTSQLPVGTQLTRAELRGGGGIRSRSCTPSTCWALGSVAGSAYPIVSHDHGVAWQVAGPILAGRGAISGGHVDDVVHVSGGVVAAFGPGSPLLLTDDAGTTWSATTQLGVIDDVREATSSRGTVQLLVVTTSPYSTTDVRAYGSTDATHWTLLGRGLLVEVPHVVGLREPAASRQLAAAGLVVNAVVPRRTTIPVPLLVVVSQSPVAGARIRLGSVVTVSFELSTRVR